MLNAFLDSWERRKILWRKEEISWNAATGNDLLTLPDNLIEFIKFHMQLGNNKKAIWMDREESKEEEERELLCWYSDMCAQFMLLR